MYFRSRSCVFIVCLKIVEKEPGLIDVAREEVGKALTRDVNLLLDEHDTPASRKEVRGAYVICPSRNSSFLMLY